MRSSITARALFCGRHLRIRFEDAARVDSISGYALLPLAPPCVGASVLWQALLAAWNLALVRMFAGNTGPFPEKLGLGRL